MVRQNFVNTYPHNFLAFFTLLCCTYIILVSAIKPRGHVKTLIVCFGAVCLAVVVTCLDRDLRRPSWKESALAPDLAAAYGNPRGSPRRSMHTCSFQYNDDEMTPQPVADNAESSDSLSGVNPEGSDDVQNLPYDDIHRLAVVHKKLLRIRRSNEGVITSLRTKLQETQSLLEEERKRYETLQSAHAETLADNVSMENILMLYPRMIPSPPDRPSFLQDRFRSTGSGNGALWDSKAA